MSRWLAPLIAALGIAWGAAQVPPDAHRVRYVSDRWFAGAEYRWRGQPCQAGVFEPGRSYVFGIVCEGDPWAQG